MMKRLLAAALFAPLSALAQTYPSPTFNNITVNGTATIANATFTNPPSFPGGIAISSLANVAANTVLANVTSATAGVTAFAMPSCSAAGNALTYTSGTGFTCATGLASLASPTFTGTPAAPTATTGTNTTQIATTAFVNSSITGMSTSTFGALYLAWFNSLPTTLPASAGVLWNNGGVLSKS
ncbi:hypothetical protein [Burkholderia gladioli]|uniref:hypothetical protein n=1 Tax=Burkholderia gladioli TaxID=28095 RepID=UPI00163F0E9E|nr:hypothetical protein [Burkholderia gladioli]